MRNHTKKFLSVLLSLAMLFTVAIPAISAAGAKNGTSLALIPYDASKLGVKKLGEVSEAVKEAAKHDPDEIVRVSIVLSGKSTLDAGFATKNVAKNASAVAYRNSLKAEQANVTAKVESAIGAALDVKHNLTLAMNVISANVRYGDIEKIEAVAGVEKVEIENRYEPLAVNDTADPDMANAVVTNGSEAVWAEGYYGAGSRIAIVDTGLMDTHQSVDPEAFDYAIAEDAANAGISVEDYNLLDADEIADVLDQLNADVSAEELYLNSKIPFHYNYVDGGTRTDHVGPGDSDQQGEHGSHVAGIAAANRYVKKDGEFVDAKEEVKAVGNAPDAQLLVMKVFGIGGGAYDSDYMAAIEDSIVLGADSVNLSLGSGNPGSAFANGYQAVMDKLQASDTVYCGSAGNSYAWDYALENDYGIYADSISLATSGSPSTYFNSLSVAASQNTAVVAYPATFQGDIKVIPNDGSVTPASFNSVAGDYEYVYVDAIGEEADFASVNEVVSLEGKVVLCNRGGISFYVKGNNADAYGPVAIIIANNAPGSINMNTTDYVGNAPIASIELEPALAIKAASEAGETEDGIAYYTGSVSIADELEAVPTGAGTDPTDFSSWGTTGALTLKPEITAPGGNIYSIHGYATEDGVTYTGGEASYELMSGTSMASPQMAGLVAALAQYVRENNLVETTGLTQRQIIHSLLMSTAQPMLTADGAYYPILQQGSGLANVKNAVDAESFIQMGEDATISAADGKVKAELGQNAARDGKYEFSFIVNNISEEDREFTVSTDLFTQALEEGYYDYVVSHDTEAIDADVAYTWEVLSTYGDVDLDGDTDEDDAQAILDIVTGIFDADYDEVAADVDGDGDITTRDAYELLIRLGEEGEALIPAGESAKVTVSIELTEEQRAEFDETRLTAWVEGFTYVSAEGDVEHSIPIVGVYGSWTDSSMFDAVTAFDAYNNNLWRESYSGNYETNGFVIKNGSSSYFFTGNPYIAEPDADPARFAVSPKATLSSVKHTLIRNAGTIVAFVFDADGNVIYQTNAENEVYGMYYYVNGGEWRNNGVSTTAIGQKLSDLGLKEGDSFSVKFFAVPEYYALLLDPTTTSGAIAPDDILALYEAGEIGEGSVLSMQATLDAKAPKILNAELSEDGNTVTVTAQDDQYIAAIALMDINGDVMYVGEIPEQSEPGEEVTVELDITGQDFGVAAAVFVGDYAANEDAALIRFADGPILANITRYYLTDTLEADAPYIVTASADVGTAYALKSNGQNYYTSSQEVTLAEDEFGVYVDDATIDDTITWNTSDGIVFTNAADGGVLGFQSFGARFASWANAGYADYFTYDGTDLDNGYASMGGYMYFQGGSFYFGGTNTPEYLFTPQTFQYEIDPDVASEVVVEPAAVTLILDVIPTVELTATVKPIVLPDKSVTWTSSDESVATVDENGLVTAVSEGSVVITAASNQSPDVVGTCKVNVVSGTPIDYTVYAQVTYGKDDMRFEAIDLNDMSTEQIAEAGSTFISGGLSGQYIWGTDTDIDVIRYDIDNDFAVQDMFSLNPTYLPLDSASFPSFSITIPAEEEGGEDTVVTHDYYYASVTKNGWLTMWTGENGSNASYFDLGADDLHLVALAFCGAYYDEETNEQDLYYYALDEDGVLYLLYIYTDGEDLSIGAQPLGTIDILTMGEDMTAFSMAYAGYGMDNESILIADNNMQAIYYVEIDLSTGALTPSYVGKLDDASSLAGLFNLDFDTVAELSAEQVAGYRGILQGAKTFTAQTADLSAEAATETAEIETLGAAGQFSLKKADKNGEVVTPDQKYTYTLDLTEDVDANNALIKVTYDTETATYVTYKSDLDFHSISVDEENGVILFAFASYDAIPAGETLATVFFASDEEDAKVYVHDEELNEELGIVDHEFGEPEWEWEGSDEDGYTAATAIFPALDEFGLTEEVEAEITVLTQEATCTEDGEVVYVATVTFKGVEYTAEKHVVLPALGHDYQGNVCTRCGEMEDCPYCGEKHDLHTIAGWWTSLLHHILYILNRIFLWWSPIAK